jgi:GT2 family glycosyltransferase
VENTFVIPVVRDDLIERCLETLYERTPPGFYVYVVDQTPGGLPTEDLRRRYENLLVLRTPRTQTHTTGNLGFSKAVNMGLALVETPYATLCNDDVEFIHPDWWAGVLRTFARVERVTPQRPAAIVTPISVKLPFWSIGQPAGDDHYVLPYRREWSNEDWEFLVEEPHRVNERLTIRPHTFNQGAELFCSVVHMDRVREIGPINERFYPGGGEDYDYSHRLRLHGYCCVSTSESWVFHQWGSSVKLVLGNRARADEALRWNDLTSLWGTERSQRTLADMPPLTSRPL